MARLVLALLALTAVNAGHCGRNELTNYCCMVACDSSYGTHPGDPNCGGAAASVTRMSDIYAIASAGGCAPLIQGECSYGTPQEASCAAQMGFDPVTMVGASAASIAAALTGAPVTSPPTAPPTDSPTHSPTNFPIHETAEHGGDCNMDCCFGKLSSAGVCIPGTDGVSDDVVMPIHLQGPHSHHRCYRDALSPNGRGCRCQCAENLTPAFTDTPKTMTDPWHYSVYTADSAGAAAGSISVTQTGSVTGHVVVVHDSSGAKAGCGQLVLIGSQDVATITMLPGYSGPDSAIAGTFTLAQTGAQLGGSYTLTGLAADVTGSFHVHEGSSCASIGGHMLNTAAATSAAPAATTGGPAVTYNGHTHSH